MSACHAGMLIVAEHGFANGGAVVDLYCSDCQTHWHQVNLAEVAKAKLYPWCDTCESKRERIADVAEALWFATGGFAFTHTNGAKGIYGVRDALTDYAFGRAPMPARVKHFADLHGIALISPG